ncbi:hypothetical protein P7C70_g2336, partial [Phenoliferia sp. Uapishka_3]
MLSAGICNSAIRIGGFGPMDGKHLTSCFNDVILLPLPTWLLLLFGLPILVISSRSNLVSSVRPSAPPRTQLMVPRSIPQPTTRSSSRFSRIITWIYRLLVLAALLMSILEITRLALSHSGIGLLPFTLAGILLAMVMLGMRARGQRKPKVVGGILMVFWGILVAFQAVKVDTLIWVENMAKAAGSKGPSMYPNSDKSLDNYVILGLYAVLFFYELVHLVLPHRQTHISPARNASSEEELVRGGKPEQSSFA